MIYILLLVVFAFIELSLTAFFCLYLHVNLVVGVIFTNIAVSIAVLCHVVFQSFGSISERGYFRFMGWDKETIATYKHDLERSK